MISLNSTSLNGLPDRVKHPKYDRSTVKQGIVHIGVGGFHRSHQAYFINKILSGGENTEWGICGIGLREADQKIYKTLSNQDGLYNLITRHPDSTIETEIIGSIVNFIWAYRDPEEALKKLSDPETKIVSLTITEGGYNFDSSTGEFNLSHPDVKHDFDKKNTPKTVFGFLTEAARRRMNGGHPSFTVMSCDNIQHNGDVAKKMFLSFAKHQDLEVYHWMLNNTTFPNSMVDRITPITTDEDLNYLQNEYSIIDRWPVNCEPFIQWVLEDNFSSTRPPLENVGVQLVEDVKPYEKMKLRLLNAGHSVLGIPGSLHGHPTINSCMEDPVFRTFMRKFMDVEATPTLDPVPGVKLSEYKDSLEERFGNRNIKDTVERICSESSAKLPKFLFETITDNLKKEGTIEMGSFIVACWFYYYHQGKNEKGKDLIIIDELSEQLRNNSGSPESFISNSSLFGELSANKRFLNSYFHWAEKLMRGAKVRQLMQDIISE